MLVNNLARDIDNFLKEQDTPVRSLKEIVDFNLQNRQLELPPGTPNPIQGVYDK